jgi:hypothetical protein
MLEGTATSNFKILSSLSSFDQESTCVEERSNKIQMEGTRHVTWTCVEVLRKIYFKATPSNQGHMS